MFSLLKVVETAGVVPVPVPRLTAAHPTRIMGYLKGISNNAYKHAWVQINLGDGWKNWDYKNITQNTTVHWVAERSCSDRSR